MLCIFFGHLSSHLEDPNKKPEAVQNYSHQTRQKLTLVQWGMGFQFFIRKDCKEEVCECVCVYVHVRVWNTKGVLSKAEGSLCEEPTGKQWLEVQMRWTEWNKQKSRDSQTRGIESGRQRCLTEFHVTMSGPEMLESPLSLFPVSNHLYITTPWQACGGDTVCPWGLTTPFCKAHPSPDQGLSYPSN